MFGYIRPYVPLLRVKDNEVYNAIYCGVCNSLDNCYGKIASASLSYDVTFLAVVRLALSGRPFVISAKKCRFNPFKRCKIAHSSDDLDFCAAVGVLLTYYKLLDNVNDEKGLRSLGARLALLLASPKRKKVIRNYGAELDRVISQHLSELSSLEEKGTKSIDLPSDLFGKMLGVIASYGYDGENAVIARSIGEGVGKWIYVTDALDDCEKDSKTDSYNPILSLYGRIPTEEELESIVLSLNAVLLRIGAAVDLIDYERSDAFDKEGDSVRSAFSDELKAIIENTVEFGMPKSCEKVLLDKARKSSD